MRAKLAYRTTPGIAWNSFSVEWKVIHEPTLTDDLKSALLSLEAKIIPVPDRHPVETIVITSTRSSNNQDEVEPCILVRPSSTHLPRRSF